MVRGHKIVEKFTDEQHATINQSNCWLINSWVLLISTFRYCERNYEPQQYDIKRSWKVDGRYLDRMESWQKVDGISMDVRKVDGSSRGFTESGWNFDRRLHVHPRDLPWNSINFLCMYRTFRQFQVRREDSPSNNDVITAFLSTSSVSTSTVRLSAGPSINFPYVCGTFYQLFVCSWDLLSTFLAAATPFVNFCQLSEHPRNIPSTFRASAELPSNSVSFSCVRGNFKKFRTAIGSSINFSHLSVQSQDFLSAFCTSAGHSVNFVNFSCIQGTVC